MQNILKLFIGNENYDAEDTIMSWILGSPTPEVFLKTVSRRVGASNVFRFTLTGHSNKKQPPGGLKLAAITEEMKMSIKSIRRLYFVSIFSKI